MATISKGGFCSAIFSAAKPLDHAGHGGRSPSLSPKKPSFFSSARSSASPRSCRKGAIRRATPEGGVEEDLASRSSSPAPGMEEYNTIMERVMRNPYENHPNLGMNYTLITENLIVGSQPQKPEDIDHLKKKENVGYILCLQEDRDIEYWRINLNAITARCKEAGIHHMRRPAMDCDRSSLRNYLPKAVSLLEWVLSEGKGQVYVHCTAGRGRAAAVAIAYMFWFCDMNLAEAYTVLTSKRPCGVSKRAIRGATCDLAKNDPWEEPFDSRPENAFANIVEWERELIQERVRALRGT